MYRDDILPVLLIFGYPGGALISFGVFAKWGWGVGAFYGALFWPGTWLGFLGWSLG